MADRKRWLARRCRNTAFRARSWDHEQAVLVNKADVSRRAIEWINQHGLSRKHVFDAADAFADSVPTSIPAGPSLRPGDGARGNHGDAARCPAVRKGVLYRSPLRSITGRHSSACKTYNLLYREEEREMIPLCKKTGVVLIPWSPMAQGMLARPYEDKTTARIPEDLVVKALYLSKEGQREGLLDQEVTGRVQKVAADRGVSMAIVALPWVLRKG